MSWCFHRFIQGFLSTMKYVLTQLYDIDYAVFQLFFYVVSLISFSRLRKQFPTNLSLPCPKFNLLLIQKKPLHLRLLPGCSANKVILSFKFRENKKIFPLELVIQVNKFVDTKVSPYNCQAKIPISRELHTPYFS